MVTHKLVCNDLHVVNLQKEILDNYDKFDQYKFRRTAQGSPHKEMTDIWVRYNDIKPRLATEDFTGFNDEHDSVWFDVVNKIPSVKKVIFDLMHKVDGERLGGVLITKLPPGGHIEKHTDAGWHARYYDKFYVPILNSKGSIFGFEDGNIEPNIGEAWWFDNSQNHWVDNKSETDRIAMIVCIRTDKYKDINANRI